MKPFISQDTASFFFASILAPPGEVIFLELFIIPRDRFIDLRLERIMRGDLVS